MSKLLLRFALLSSLALALAGCSAPTDEPKPTKTEEPCPLCAVDAKTDGEGCDCCAKVPVSAETAKVEMKSVKPGELLKAIEGHKGKVVVVDVWASFCAPCKREFPHFTKLHAAYAADGVVCLSLSVDEADDSGKALRFLQDQKATMTNYHLDDAKGELAESWGIESIPMVMVYGRDGKRAARFSNDVKEFTYEADVVPLVRKLSRQK